MEAREDLLEYRIELRTGEIIEIAELDSGRTPALLDPDISKSLADLLSRCTSVARDVIQAAKSGDTKPLEAKLGTPPRGCLIKVGAVCSEIRSCVSADRKRCRTDFWLEKEKRAAFPLCWQAPVPDTTPASKRLLAVAIGTAIVHAWREGRLVVVIDG